jgi:clathrin heavy chain
LTMARKKVQDPMIDTELVYAYCKTGKLVDLEQFIMGPNIANVGALGERCYTEELYEAAKIMFNNVGDFGRLVTTLCKLNDLAGAVDAARKANTIQTWRDVCKAAIDEKEFRIAQQCAIHIIVEPDELEDLISYYEQEGYVEEIMEVIEGGIGLERAHMYAPTSSFCHCSSCLPRASGACSRSSAYSTPSTRWRSCRSTARCSGRGSTSRS